MTRNIVIGDVGDLLESVRLERISPSVLAYGLQRNLLSVPDVVAVELSKFNSSIALSNLEERLALKLHDDLDDVVDLLCQTLDDDGVKYAQHVWAFVAARKLRKNWATLAQPLQQLAAVMELLDTPIEYEDFLHYLPLKPFRKKYGRTSFLDVLDAQLEADAMSLGYGA